VIALDTNYLINALVAGSPEATALIAWHRNGEVLAAPSMVWYEFLCGPVSVLTLRQERANYNAPLAAFTVPIPCGATGPLLLAIVVQGAPDGGQ
jgi:hypothetical protein